MKHGSSSVITIVLVAVSCAAHSADDCAVARGKVSIEGPQPATDRLLRALPNSESIRFARGTFNEERVRFLGRMPESAGGWQLLFIDTTWGESCRLTTRLLVFTHDDRYVGRYDGLEEPERIVDASMLFSTGDKVVMRTGALPPSIWLGGEHHDFEPANAPSGHASLADAANLGRVCIERPESNGGINILPVWIHVGGASTTLIGGQSACFTVDATATDLWASSTEPYEPEATDMTKCSSARLQLRPRPNETVSLRVKTVSSERGYECGWLIEH